MENFTDVKESLTKCLRKLKNNNDGLQKDISDLYDRNRILKILVSENDIEKLKTLGRNLEINLAMVNRAKMKCVFFGKTSNGKSAVINAILHRDVLPSSGGSTTSCFIAVEGCLDDEGYIRTDANSANIPLEELEELSSYYGNDPYGVNKMITIYWPIRYCNLLQHEIQLVDSPGVDFSVTNDAQIRSFCQDSDVFVYVVDAVSTLCQSERSFFEDVKNHIGNPTVFVLLNKWDLCEANKPATLNRIKDQHLKTIKNIFETNMHIVCEEEKRVFFVSATKSLAGPTPEFERFIRSLTWEMNQHAVVTKFRQHSERGNDSIATVTDIADKIIKSVNARGDVRFPIKNVINNLITETFDNIKRESLESMQLKCKQYSSTISNSITRGTSSIDFISPMIENQFYTLFSKIKGGVDNLLPKTRELLRSHSPVTVEDILMEIYVPRSFDESISRFKTDIDKKEKRNNEIEKAYNGLTNYLRPPVWDFKRMSESVGPVLAFGGILLKEIFRFFAKAVQTVTELVGITEPDRDRRPDLEAELCNKIYEYLSGVVTEEVLNSKGEITERINVFTDVFVRDYKEMWELLEKVRRRRSELDDIQKDLMMEKDKISSMDNSTQT